MRNRDWWALFHGKSSICLSIYHCHLHIPRGSCKMVIVNMVQKGEIMKSIKNIYKIGHGLSSSYTMGTSFAAKRFIAEHPDADLVKSILYGSLAKTGKGHGTDRAIAETFYNILNVFQKVADEIKSLRAQEATAKAKLEKAQRLIPGLNGFAIGLTATIHPFPNTTIW